MCTQSCFTFTSEGITLTYPILKPSLQPKIWFKLWGLFCPQNEGESPQCDCVSNMSNTCSVSARTHTHTHTCSHHVSMLSEAEINQHDPGIRLYNRGRWKRGFTFAVLHTQHKQTCAPPHACTHTQTHTNTHTHTQTHIHTTAGLNQIECILILFLQDQGGLENSRAHLTAGTLKPNKHSESAP